MASGRDTASSVPRPRDTGSPGSSRAGTPLTRYSPLAFISRVFSTSRGWHRNVAHPPWRASCHQWVCQEGTPYLPSAGPSGPPGGVPRAMGTTRTLPTWALGIRGLLPLMQSLRRAATILAKASHHSEPLLHPGAPSCQGWSGTPHYSPQ